MLVVVIRDLIEESADTSWLVRLADGFIASEEGDDEDWISAEDMVNGNNRTMLYLS